MWKIRTTKTKSKKTAVQVVFRQRGKTFVVKHIGSANTNEDLVNLRLLAENYIKQNDPSRRLPLDFPEMKIPHQDHLISVENLSFTNFYHLFAYEFFNAFYVLNGFNTINSTLIRDLTIIRMAEPASKLRSIELLAKYFDTSYSKNVVYKNILKFNKFKDKVEEIAIAYAKKHLTFDFSLVFYDVTTLYFESFASDEDKRNSEGKIIAGLRKCGFSKDSKSNQPQILIALVVNTHGYPVASQIFEGNKFEGHTIIPVILSLKKKYSISNLTIVADAAMLSKDNVEELNKNGLNYIVGARLSNISEQLIKDISEEIKSKPGTYFKTKKGDINDDKGLGYLICDFSELRALKDRSDRNKQIIKAQRQINDPGKYVKHSRFVRETTASAYELNRELMAKDELMDGIKGYYTNLEDIDNHTIVDRYHDLWKIEKAFRIAKSDLSVRPVFLRKRESVEAHVLIVFISLCVTKSMELITGMSLKKIHDLIWDVLDLSFEDKLTKMTFKKRMSNIPAKALEILTKISNQ